MLTQDYIINSQDYKLYLFIKSFHPLLNYSNSQIGPSSGWSIYNCKLNRISPLLKLQLRFFTTTLTLPRKARWMRLSTPLAAKTAITRASKESINLKQVILGLGATKLEYRESLRAQLMMVKTLLSSLMLHQRVQIRGWVTTASTISIIFDVRTTAVI